MFKLFLSECFLGVIVFVKFKDLIKVQGQKGGLGDQEEGTWRIFMVPDQRLE